MAFDIKKLTGGAFVCAAFAYFLRRDEPDQAVAVLAPPIGKRAGLEQAIPPIYEAPPNVEATADVPPQPKYKASISPRGQLVLTLDDITLGSIFDSPLYREADYRFKGHSAWLTDYQKEILFRVEGDAPSDFKSNQRVNSGKPGWTHVYGMVEDSLKLSLRTEIPLDFIIFLTELLHEKIEEAPVMKERYKIWLGALKDGDERKLADYDAKLREARTALQLRLAEDVKSYISSLVKGSTRASLVSDIDKTVRLVRALTRDRNINPYYVSMRFAYTVDGNEGLDQTLRKMLVKNVDGSYNLREIDPISAEQMAQLRMAFGDPCRLVGDGNNGQQIEYIVGEELRKKFGSLDKDGIAMSAAARIDNAAKRIAAFHYQNRTLSRYAAEAFQTENGRTAQLYALTRLSRDEMVQAAVSCLESAIGIYRGKEEVQREEERVKQLVDHRRGTTYFDRLTAQGDVKDWLLLDIAGGEFIRSLDDTPEDRIRNYEAAMMLLELVPRFSMHHDPRVRDPKGRYILLSKADKPFKPEEHEFFTLSNFKRFVSEDMPEYKPYLMERVQGLNMSR